MSDSDEPKPFIWEGEELRTLGKIMDAVSKITDEGDAAKAALFLATFREVNPHADENIGYLSGYLDPQNAVKMMELFKVTHPFFGSVVPSPEEAFEAGKARGKPACECGARAGDPCPRIYGDAICRRTTTATGALLETAATLEEAAAMADGNMHPNKVAQAIDEARASLSLAAVLLADGPAIHPFAARWKHDCDTCELIATIDDADGSKYDLYVHKNVLFGPSPSTVVARFGDDGPEYLSATPVLRLWINGNLTTIDADSK